MKQFRKLLCLACTLVLCVATILPAAVHAESGTTMYVVAKNYVNMRSEANTQTSTIITQVPDDAAVTVIEIENGWAEVTYDEKTGFIYTSYLTKKNPNPTTMWVETGKSSGLNFREAPNGALIEELPNGTQVLVYYVEDGWACISADGKEGFSFYTYLTATNPSEDEGADAPGAGEGTDTPDDGTDTTPPAPTGTAAKVKEDGTNAYSEPRSSASVVATYDAGKEVLITRNNSNGWSIVYADGKVVYMLTSALEAVTAEDSEGEGTENEGAEGEDGEQAPAPSLPSEYTLMKVKGGKLAFRSTPEKKSNNVICFYNTGTEVKVYATANGWAQVAVDGQVGYMMTSFLEKVQAEEDQPEEDENEQPEAPALPGEYTLMKVKGGKLAFRTAPVKKSNNVICFYNTGTEVKVYATANGWAQVAVDGQVGFMVSSYLEKVETEEDQPDGEETEQPEAPSLPGEYKLMNVKGGKLALRSTPEKKSNNLIKFLNDGAEVKVYATANGWALVIAGGNQGYVVASYLETATADAEQPEEGEQPGSTVSYQAEVNTGSTAKLRLRSEPNTTSDILGSYPNGTKVTVLSTADGWCKVSVDGKEGYMGASKLKKVEAESEQPDSEQPGSEEDGDDNNDNQQSAPSGSVFKTIANAKSSFVNLRTSTSTANKSNIIAELANGTVVKVVSEHGLYTKVSVDGQVGYVVSSYLK